MEADFCPLLTQESKPQVDFELLSASTDLGYYSACSSLSPTSSVDSSCFSPPVCQFRAGFDWPMEPAWTSQSWEKPTAAETRRTTRSKNPGKKRQSASEREKLRMRDLTKALHHLRSFLPPSVAPAGQTLTKIETLRLTIRYISYLSSMLGHEENFSHAGNVQSHSAASPVQQGGFSDRWSQNAVQEDLQYSGQHCQPPTMFTASAQQMETSSVSTAYYSEAPLPLFPSHTSQTHSHCDLAALI
ncbi:hypothetical protein AOLI_G00055820 [Acnodon oligacanthus]